MISCRISRCTTTSSAVVGSSMMISFGSSASAIARHDALAHAAGELVRIVVEPLRPGCRPAQQLARRAPAPRRGPRRYAGRCTSRNCSKTVITGLSEFIALWNTIDTLRQRQRCELAPASKARMSSPSMRIVPSDDRSPAGGAAASARRRRCSCRSRIRRQGPMTSPSADVEVDAVDRGEERRAASGSRPAGRAPRRAWPRHLRRLAAARDARAGRARAAAARRALSAPSVLQPRIGNLVDAEIDQRQPDADHARSRAHGANTSHQAPTLIAEAVCAL